MFFVKYFHQRLLSLVNMGLHAAIIWLSPLIHKGEQLYKPCIVGDPWMVTPSLWKILAMPLQLVVSLYGSETYTTISHQVRIDKGHQKTFDIRICRISWGFHWSILNSRACLVNTSVLKSNSIVWLLAIQVIRTYKVTDDYHDYWQNLVQLNFAKILIIIMQQAWTKIRKD